MHNLELDHIGIQVRDLERSAALFARLFGYRQVTRPVENSRHGVRGLFLEKPGSVTLKLITPVGHSGTQSYGLHHLAFLSNDIHASLEELRSGGARIITGPQPGEMFDDELIAFLFAAGINVELVTTRRWRGRLDGDDPEPAVD